MPIVKELSFIQVSSIRGPFISKVGIPSLQRFLLPLHPNKFISKINSFIVQFIYILRITEHIITFYNNYMPP